MRALIDISCCVFARRLLPEPAEVSKHSCERSFAQELSDQGSGVEALGPRLNEVSVQAHGRQKTFPKEIRDKQQQG